MLGWSFVFFTFSFYNFTSRFIMASKLSSYHYKACSPTKCFTIEVSWGALRYLEVCWDEWRSKKRRRGDKSQHPSLYWGVLGCWGGVEIKEKEEAVGEATAPLDGLGRGGCVEMGGCAGVC